MTLANIGLISHASATLAFLALMALVCVGWRRGLVGASLVFACAATITWAANRHKYSTSCMAK